MLDDNGMTPATLRRVPPLDLLRLFWVVWYGKWIIAATVALAVWLATGYAFQPGKVRYAATATLQVNPALPDPRDVRDHWPAPPTDLASLNTEVAILRSDNILGKVVTAQGLLDDPEFNRYLTPADGLTLNRIRTGLRHAIAGTQEQPPDAGDVSEKTIANLRAALTARHLRDTYLITLTVESRDADKAAQLANAVAAAYLDAQITAKARTAEQGIVWLQTRVDDLRRTLQEQEEAIASVIATAQIQNGAGLDLLSQAVLSTDQEQADVRATLAGFDTGAPLTPRQSAEVARLQTALSEIGARRDRLSAQLTVQSSGLSALQQMQREAQATRVLYDAFLVRLQETQVQRGLDTPDSRLIAPAVTGSYAGPRKVLIIQVAAVLGLLAGLLAVAVQYATRRGILTPAMLAAITGRPAAAVFPRAAMRDGPTGSRANSALRALRAQLILNAGDTPPKVLLCIGAAPRDGAEQLARALATDLGGSSGPVPICDAADLLAQPDRITDRIATLRKAQDRTIILAQGISPAELALVSQSADATILAVRWGSGPLGPLRALWSHLAQSARNPVLTVLTHAHPARMRRFARIYRAEIT